MANSANTAKISEPASTAGNDKDLTGGIETPTAFLRAIHDGLSDDLWVNVAAISHSPEYVGECFTLGDVRNSDCVEDFVDRYRDHFNIYYGPNLLARPAANNKATSDDIDDDIYFVYADIDPPSDVANHEQWRERKFAELLGGEMTVLMDSGNGAQLIWRLTEPVSKARARELNRIIADCYGGDAVINVDRLLRMPFTMNYPNAVKIRAGRGISPTRLVRFESKSFSEAIFAAQDALADLPVSAQIKHIIRTGQHPRDPERYPSPSEARMAVVMAMIRAHVPRARIAEILADTRYPLVGDDKKRRPRWIEQELDRLYREAVPDWVRKLNHRYFVAVVGGHTRVVEHRMDDALKRMRLDLIPVNAFEQFYANKFVENPNGNRPRQVAMGRAWIKHPMRRTYDGVVLRPDAGPVVDNRYNLWQGFAVAPRPGDCQLFKDHLRQVICDDNQKLYEYLWNWMARAVQEPHKPAEVAIVLLGPHGAGKGVFVRTFGELFGTHFLHISSAKHLVGHFNAHLRGTVVLFADEALWAGDHAAASQLKSLVTEPTVAIEGKGVDVELGRNMLHILMASNSDWAVPAGAQERRFLVLKVSDRHAQEHAYFKALLAQMAAGGSAALLHELQTTDLSGWNPRAVPQTEALRDQQIRSLDPVEHFMLQCLLDGRFTEDFAWARGVPRDLFYEHYVAHSRAMGKSHTVSRTSLGRTLKRWGKTNKRLRMHWDDERIKDKMRHGDGWVFLPLAECRRLFVEDMGWDDWQWPDVDADEEVSPDF